MKRYQLMTIIDPAAGESNIASVQRAVEEAVEQRGGHVEEAARPERVKLATPMRGVTEGFRGFSVVAIPEDRVSSLQLTLRHQDGVLRSMLVVAQEDRRSFRTRPRDGASIVRRSFREKFSPLGSASPPPFEDEAITREINAVIEREVEKVSREEKKARPTGHVEPRISEEEVRGIDKKLDEILGE